MSGLPTIYAHRGFWHDPSEQNSMDAIRRAGEFGFGVETDFRSQTGELILSHDPLPSPTSTPASRIDFRGIPTAINIKEDGLLNLYADFLAKNSSPKSFIFDGSIPEMFQIHKQGLPHALRMSEYEREIPWDSTFLWIDGFVSEWWADQDLMSRLAEKYFLIFVSPEIHAREYTKSWTFFRDFNNTMLGNFGICTDYPSLLTGFLNE